MTEDSDRLLQEILNELKNISSFMIATHNEKTLLIQKGSMYT